MSHRLGGFRRSTPSKISPRFGRKRVKVSKTAGEEREGCSCRKEERANSRRCPGGSRSPPRAWGVGEGRMKFTPQASILSLPAKKRKNGATEVYDRKRMLMRQQPQLGSLLDGKKLFETTWEKAEKAGNHERIQPKKGKGRLDLSQKKGRGESRTREGDSGSSGITWKEGECL